MSHKVRIIYKSGVVQDVKCDDFKVAFDGGTLTRISWDNARPRPLFIGVDHVEAIYEL